MNIRSARVTPSRLLRILASIVVLAVVLLDVAVPAFLAPFERLEYDALFRHARPRTPFDPRLVVVQIDDDTLGKAGAFPVPRQDHARLSKLLAQAGVRVVAWDLLFDREDPEDAALASAFAAVPTVLAISARPSRGAVDIASDARRFTIPPEPDASPDLPPFEVGIRPASRLADAAHGGGHVWSSVDPDGSCRRVPLVLRTGDRWLPALALAASLPLLGVGPDAVHVLPGPRLRIDLPEGPAEIPLDAGGTLLVDYVAVPQMDVRSYFSLLDSLQEAPEEMRPGLQGKLVLIGETETGSGDFVATPAQRSLPGVFVTASLINEILTRRVLRTAGWWVPPLLAIALAGVVVLADGFGGPIVALAVAGLSFLGLFSGAWLAFSRGHSFVPIPAPLLAVGVTAALLGSGSLLLEQRRARRVSGLLARFVSPALLEQSQSNAALRPRREELTILFVDLEGFTDFTEVQEPEVVSDLLARFYEMAMEELFRAGGTLDEFKGDGVLAYFGELPDPGSAVSAVRAAMAIRGRFGEINGYLASKGRPHLGIRCGLASGWVSVGYFGGDRFASYGVVGRAVNLAARIQALAERDQILVDEPTAARLRSAFTLRALTPVTLKGVPREVALWSVET
jgi:adenylate cyclase